MFARALTEWDRVTSKQMREMSLAGRDPNVARPRSWMVECALLWALRNVGAPHGIVGILPPSVAQVKPLSEQDARPVEPLDPKEKP